jgi:ATP-dependent DNA helicase RecQ
MPDFSRFLFFDLEYNPKLQKVREYGYILGEEQVRDKDPAKLETASDKASFIVGHNVLRHDAPILKQYFSIDFPSIKVLDTLMLSSLLFPQKPYHKLRKEYLQNEEEPSNPLKDAELCRNLLEDCIKKWEEYPWQLRYLLFQFLKKEPGFSPFFQLAVVPKSDEIRSKWSEVQKWFCLQYDKSICLHQNFENEWSTYRAEWCFLLTLFYEEGPSDFVPHWVRYQYPHLESILHRCRLIPCGKSKCSYCTEQLNSTKQLQKWFRLPGFRSFSEEETIPLQQQVVESAMRGESLLAVFPTGGGKSMTFQLPALIAGSQIGALTVVISPIVALMKDQVDVLTKRFGIDRATFINSDISPLERKNAFRAIFENEKDILYISPEALRSNTIFKLLKYRRINRFVIDEAHCFSSWGQDFRVDYLYLADFIKELEEAKKLETHIPISCFTATAKQDVVNDICGYFKKRMNLDLVKLVSTAVRTNLEYSVISASKDKHERSKELIDLLKQYNGPKIIYASTVKATERLAEGLHEYGFKSGCYHGQMESDKKMEVQEEFQKNDGKIDTMVATTAFGMGVDKDNVELVAHYEISSSLENYVQEAGRAGRNPDMQAYCVALYNSKDLDTNFQILQQNKLAEKEIGEVWRVLRKQSEKRERIVMSALEIADKCGWTEQTENIGQLGTKVKHAIMLLEDQGFLKRNRNQTQVFGSSITIESVSQVRSVLDSPNIDKLNTIENIAYRIMRHIITKRWTKNPECALDDITVNLGIERKDANEALRLLRSKHLLDQHNDWSAKIQRLGTFNSKRMLARAKDLQEVLLKNCEGHSVDENFLLNLTKVNAARGITESGTESRKCLQIMRGILRYWAHESIAEIHLIEAGHQLYRIEFLKEPELVRKNLQSNWECFEKIIDTLLVLQKEQSFQKEESNKNGELADDSIWFSIDNLILRIYGEKDIEDLARQAQFEFALLFLHLIGAIHLENGLMVFYTGLVLDISQENSSRVFRESDFKKLHDFYENKAEAIHIVGKYAETMLYNKQAAQELLNDYFTLDIQSFRQKYMMTPEERGAVSINLRERIGAVNKEQKAIIKSSARHILVGAGPGSGKTHMLVHKAASLLWLEETQPNSLLVLTFTRSACREIRKRLNALALGLAHGVTITTFHALAFSILGIQGSKKDFKRRGKENNSEDIIDKAAEVIMSGEDVGIGAPGVVLVDEFQDLSSSEYKMLKAIYNYGDKPPRIIAVGDDDQSIFEFRGSSSEYFRKFATEFPNTKEFYLTNNYRSAAKIVRGNEEILSYLDYRVKSGKRQTAINLDRGELDFYEEHDVSRGAFAAAQILLDKKKDVKESACILSPKNAESFLAAAKLEELGEDCRIIKGLDKEKCSVESIREIIGFKQIVETDQEIVKRPWTIEQFKQMAERYKEQHREESSFKFLDSVVSDFVDCEDEVTLGGFVQYLNDISYADLNDKKQQINVGTMHSSKGLEWDHVVLNLGNWKPETQEQLRLLYVAATRAKKTLTVLGVETNLPKSWIKNFAKKGRLRECSIPKKIHIETGLGDLKLGHILINDKNKNRTRYLQQKFEKLPLGTVIEIGFNQEFQSYNTKYNGRLIAAFSNNFVSDYLENLQKYSYSPQKAKLLQVCRWQDDLGQEIWVPLLRVEFGK